MGRHELTSDGKLLVGVLVAFVAIALLAALDLASDLREGTTVGHVVAEGGVFFPGNAFADDSGQALDTQYIAVGALGLQY